MIHYENYHNVTQRHEGNSCCWKNGVDRLTPYRVATELQFVLNTLSAKCKKMMYTIMLSSFTFLPTQPFGRALAHCPEVWVFIPALCGPRTGHLPTLDLRFLILQVRALIGMVPEVSGLKINDSDFWVQGNILHQEAS